MKAKVLKYASDGNTLVMPYKEIHQFENMEGVYYYTEPDGYEGEFYNIVFDISGVYVHQGSYRKETIFKPENMAIIQPSKDAYLTKWQSGWVQSIYIRVYELLGIDTTPLIEKRKQMEAEREAKKQVEAEEKARQAKIYAQKEAERLDAVFSEFKNGKLIGVNDFLSVLRHKNINVHPRTVGMLNKFTSTSEIGVTSARLGYYGKKKVPRAAFDSVFEITEKLAAL